MSKTIHVRIGKIEKGSGDVILSSILGSCVAVCIYCERQGVYTMSHCLLSNSVEKTDPELPGRHVPNAIRAMLKEIDACGISRRMLKAIIVGGGNVSRKADGANIFEVGKQNSQAAIDELLKQRIPVSYKDTGGHLARQVEVHCSSGDVKVRTLPKENFVERI